MIAIIPARSGSKGLPGKNIKLLAGKPLIYYTISCALLAKSISEVFVTTDDPDIASIAKEYGAKVPFIRPKHLAEDNSLAIDVYIHAIDEIGKQKSIEITEFVALLPTVPFRQPKDIDLSVKKFYEYKADSVISVTESPVPIDWYRKIDVDGRIRNYLPEFDAIKNRQDSEITYVPNGAVYVFSSKILRQQRKYYSDNTYAHIMPKERSVDIDDDHDFRLAECLIN